MNTQLELPTAVRDTAENVAPLATSVPAAVPETFASEIRPAQGWQLLNVRELWQFRELLCLLIWRDVTVRYKQTVLGAAWAVLQPALMMVVFSIFFGRLAGVTTEVAYPLFVYAGLLPWTFFATAVANAGNSVIGSERLITKIYFPRLAIPFASVGAAVVDFVIAFGLLLGLMAYYRVAPSFSILLLPVMFSVMVLAALGVGTLLAALNVAYRDFRYVIPFLLQLWMFATPTIYMQVEAAGPEGGDGWWQALLALNPMTGLVGAFRAGVLGQSLDWERLAVSTAAIVLAFFVGCLYFRKVEDGFADII